MGLDLRRSLPPKIKEEEFDDFLNNLQKYRITATFIALMYLYGFEGEHTREQCTALLQILKPEKIFMDSRESNRIEAVLHSKQLGELEVYMNFAAAPPVTKDLLHQLQSLKLKTQKRRNKDQFCDFIITLLHFLHSELLPNLHYFEFYGEWEDKRMPDFDELREKLEQFTPIRYIHPTRRFQYIIGPDRHTCCVNVYSDCITITFKRAA